MPIVFAALQRSAEGSDPRAQLGFTCEKTANLAEHEECMRTGVGATGSMHGA